MMAKFTRDTTASLTGFSANFETSVVIEADGLETKEPTVTAAKVGTLTTRTDNDTGVATMNAGHGFVTGDELDVFWTGGQRRGMTATVATNAVTIDGGTGDNLPVLSTPLTVKKPQQENFEVVGADLKALAASSPKPGAIKLLAADDTVLLEIPITSDNGVYTWDTETGITNPLAGVTVAKALFSHSNSAASHKMKLGALSD